ncbi:MAG: hypothetical protein Q9178_004936 [Gyalolechia marmorata]
MPSHTHLRSSPTPSYRSVYVCAAAELVLSLGGAICSVPWTRLLESAVCRRHYASTGSSEAIRIAVASSIPDLLRGVLSGIGPGGEMDEALCKGDNVQAEMAGLMGTMASFAIIPRVIFGAWLSKSGAASAMLLGVTITSTIIPILAFLPGSAARSPKPGENQRTPMARSADYPSNSISSTASPRVRPERPDSEDLIDREQLVAAKRFRKASNAIVRLFSHIPFDNPLYAIFLAIMFLNGLAMDVRGQLRPWTSKRYDWPLATVGYILSVESFLGVGILLALPWLDRVRRPLRQSLSAASHTTASAAVPPLAEEEAIAATRAVLAKRRREILVARVSLGLAAGGAVLLALATNRAAFIVGLAAMTGAVGFPDAIRAFFTSYFATADIQGLYASVTVVETLSVVVGSPIWGMVYAHAYRSTSAWLGTPFAVCAVLLVCTLGLVLGLRV